MNKYKFFNQSKSFVETMTPDEIFHLGVSFAQERIVGWLGRADAETDYEYSCASDWADWLEAKIDAEDQET